MLEALTFCPLGDVLHEASEARTKPRASPSPCSILAHAHRNDAESGAVERALMHVQTGFLRTIITESPRKNILLIKRSLLIGFACNLRQNLLAELTLSESPSRFLKLACTFQTTAQVIISFGFQPVAVRYLS